MHFDVRLRKMSRLGSHPNVYNTCLNVLRRKGFEVSIYREDEATEIHQCLWEARKDDYDFLAANPIELLGLATVFEVVDPSVDKPYWWRIDEDDIYEELVDRAYPETLEDD